MNDSEMKLLTRHATMDHPEYVHNYCDAGGYQSLEKAIADPDASLQIILNAGLRGRSGSGFPAGIKWNMTAQENAAVKYIVCNADEGEPGTGKDHLLLTKTPHAIIEGMLIAAAVVGAQKGYIYIRGEYQDAIEIFEKAIKEAYAAGFLGKNIQGSSMSFELELRSGAGSYLCGEETALLESIEGRRGEVRLKPPYPGVKGLWNCPTLIHNVETFANIPCIIEMGAEAYRLIGTKECPGTKLVTVSGCVNAPGIYEVAMGTTIRTILELAGGCQEEKQILGIQTGGGSGSIIRPALLDTPFDIEHCNEIGAFFGAGDLMFIGNEIDLVDLCDNMIGFFEEESCGRCIPCRVGLPRIRKMLQKIESGKSSEDDVLQLYQLADEIKQTARCALGSAAVGPLLSIAQNFPEVFREKEMQKVGEL